jgi:hypothetical protein
MGAKQRHLQAAILLEFEPVCGGNDLTDGKAQLLTAVVDAAPLRSRSISRKVCGQIDGSLEIGSIDQEAHLSHPADEDQNGSGSRDRFGKRPEPRHKRHSQDVGFAITAVIGFIDGYRLPPTLQRELNAH